jgi:DNA-binding response OmpR family regulator
VQSSSQLLVLSPDRAILQTASSSVSSLGHGALQARTAGEAQDALSRVRVDLICCDSVVPEEELDHLWRWLASDRGRATPPVVLLAPPSARVLPSTLPGFFRPQRDGLVTKPIDRAGLAQEISRVLAAQGRDDGSLLRAGAVTLDTANQQLLFAGGQTVSLTPTELRLVSALMEHPGEYVSPEALLQQVWGFPPGTGGAEIVRAHISNVRRKLRMLGEDPQLIRSIPYRGYGFF